MKKLYLIGGIIGILAVGGYVYASYPSLTLVNPQGEDVYQSEDGSVYVGEPDRLGSVQQASEYQATTTDGLVSGYNTVVSNGYGTLGSVVITKTSASALNIYNATSTTDVASTTIVQLPSSTATGTYTFDIAMPRGIIVDEVSGFDGDYVITYR